LIGQKFKPTKVEQKKVEPPKKLEFSKIGSKQEAQTEQNNTNKKLSSLCSTLLKNIQERDKPV